MNVPAHVIISAAAVAVSVPLFVWGMTAGARQQAVSRQLARTTGPVDQRIIRLQTPAMDRAVIPGFRGLAERARRLTPIGWLEALDRRVQLVGPDSWWTIDRALAVKLLLAVAGTLGGLWGVSRVSGGGGALLLVVTPVVGYLLPDLLIRERAKERQQRIGLNLPDTLDQVTISVEAGLGFDAALAYAVETGSGPLTEELARLLREVQLGVPRNQGLRNLVDRTDVPDLRHFVFAIRQAEEYGLPIAHVLRIQSKELRIRRRQRAEEQALKIPVKLVFPLAFCIFPSLFIVLLGPAFIRILDVLSN